MRRLFLTLAAGALLFSCAKVLVEHEVIFDTDREVHQYLKSGKDSTLVQKTVFDSADHKIEVTRYKDLKLEGEYDTWYPNGNKSLVHHFEKGLLQGESSWWSESGVVDSQKVYN